MSDFDLFGFPITSENSKTHERLRDRQESNLDSHHHPIEKIAQLENFSEFLSGDILELFSGKGNLTKFYSEYGNVHACTKETTGDSFKYVYKLAANNKKFNVIDIDGYGLPSSFMDIVFKLMKPECLLILTFPVVGVQCVNGIFEQHYVNHWKSSRPTTGDIVGCTTDFGLRHWFLPKLIDVVKINKIWRIIFLCNRIKATEMTNTRNR